MAHEVDPLMLFDIDEDPHETTNLVRRPEGCRAWSLFAPAVAYGADDGERDR